MVICIVALIVLSILSIFSAKYRNPAKAAFRCVYRMVTLRPCDVQLENKIKTSLASKLMFAPPLARFFYKHFKAISWLFTIIFFASLIYSSYGVYNIIVYGSCIPGSACVITALLGICILVIERTIVYILLTILIITLIYFTIKRRKNRKNFTSFSNESNINNSKNFQTNENQFEPFKSSDD